MKKKIVQCLMIISAAALAAACSQAPDAPFCFLSLLDKTNYDRTEYSVVYKIYSKTVNNEIISIPGGEVINDVDKSSLVITLEKDGNSADLARLKTELTVTYKEAAEGDALGDDGVPADVLTSEVLFEAYVQGGGTAPLLPLSVENTAA